MISGGRLWNTLRCSCQNIMRTQKGRDFNFFAYKVPWAHGTFLEGESHNFSGVPIRQIGDHVLRTNAEHMSLRSVYDKAMLYLTYCMKVKMAQSRSLGFCAPQVGISQRLIGIRVTPRELSYVVNEYGIEGAMRKKMKLFPLQFYINPEISAVVDKTLVLHRERCASIKGFSALVPRYKSVEISAYNRKGGKVRFQVKGYLAALFQHEIDHLNGILMTDKMIARTIEKDNWVKNIDHAEEQGYIGSITFKETPGGN